MAGRRAAPIVVAVAGLAILGAGQGVVNRMAIENRLATASARALQVQGIAGARVSFTGRDGVIRVTGTPAQARRAQAVVAGVDGVRVATATLVPAPVPGSATPRPPATSPGTTGTFPPVGLTFANGVLTVSGTVPSSAVDAGIVAILAASGQWAVVDRTQIDAAVPQATSAWVTSLGGLAAAVPPSSSLIVARFEGDRVIMRGHPASAALERQMLAAAAASAGGPGKVLDGLDVGTRNG